MQPQEQTLVGGELGERALTTRGVELSKIAAKVTRYEALLGASLDKLRARLEELDANITAAALLLAPAPLAAE